MMELRIERGIETAIIHRAGASFQEDQNHAPGKARSNHAFAHDPSIEARTNSDWSAMRLDLQVPGGPGPESRSTP